MLLLSMCKALLKELKEMQSSFPQGTFRQTERWVKFTNDYGTKQTMIGAITVVQNDNGNKMEHF